MPQLILRTFNNKHSLILFICVQNLSLLVDKLQGLMCEEIFSFLNKNLIQ